MLTAGVALWSLFTVITPQAAAAGTAPLMAARVLLGVGEGVAFPAIHSMIGRCRAAGQRTLCLWLFAMPAVGAHASTLTVHTRTVRSQFHICIQALVVLDSNTARMQTLWWTGADYCMLTDTACALCPQCAARNVPVSKRSTAVGVITAASYAGTALAFGLSPLLITKFGWQWVFYLFGGAALVWLPFWLPLNVYSRLPGADSSNSSSRKSGKTSPDGTVEQQALLPRTAGSSSTALAGPSGGNGSSSGVDAAAGDLTGFRALLKRREVWAICVCQFTQSYAMYGLLNWLPTFFSDYYEVQVGDLAGYTLLPYFVQVRRPL